MHCISENTQEFQIIQKVLLANKNDLSPETHRISREEGLELAEKHRIDFFEVSAKEGRGIDEAFLRLAELVVKAQQTGDQVSISSTFYKQLLCSNVVAYVCIFLAKGIWQ